ncbi:Ankyrin [Operophtera brumata]|uniref:Ankyrin n=1 Tax=Operophtera brumata TaxID=104452 RepID=A0A0L7KXL6_OPEBR|nr:Ankyrin [Operophtera brumata]
MGGDALALLIKFGAEKLRIDRLGRTPLHLAAYAGHAKQVAILLDFPEGEMKLKSTAQSIFEQCDVMAVVAGDSGRRLYFAGYAGLARLVARS